MPVNVPTNLKSRTRKNPVRTGPLARPFARTAHSFAGSALLASLARSAALICSLARSLAHSRARGEEVIFFYGMNARRSHPVLTHYCAPPDSAPSAISATDRCSAKELSPDTNPPQDSHPLGTRGRVLLLCHLYRHVKRMK